MVTNITLPTVNGDVHCVFAVDCFTKWVEVCPLNSKDAVTLANWFYLHLVARFSKPSGCGWIEAGTLWEPLHSFVKLRGNDTLECCISAKQWVSGVL